MDNAQSPADKEGYVLVPCSKVAEKGREQFARRDTGFFFAHVELEKPRRHLELGRADRGQREGLGVLA